MREEDNRCKYRVDGRVGERSEAESEAVTFHPELFSSQLCLYMYIYLPLNNTTELAIK